MDLTGLFYPWGFLLQGAAILHFVRRRPDTYWLWIILVGGGLGALVYIVAEAVPDVELLRGPVNAFPRRRRIKDLERIIIDNPAIGNQEELADLYLEDGRFARARELYDKVVSPRLDSVDPVYRRAIAELALDDAPAAVIDLERVIAKDPKYDLHRAIGLLAHAYARSGQPDRADATFKQATAISTLSETYYHYAAFLLEQERHSEAREWADRILAKKATMPRYLRRRERPWFRKAGALVKQAR
ncbi:MAG TPA: tetratricopeptide repeat protein [Vicinamibacterales bacterium]|jgi:hypothetical protein